jgi:hypothetical protein
MYLKVRGILQLSFAAPELAVRTSILLCSLVGYLVVVFLAWEEVRSEGFGWTDSWQGRTQMDFWGLKQRAFGWRRFC